MEVESAAGKANAAELPWRRFPLGRPRILANRWLDRRRAVVFVAWYLLVVVPVLLLISRTPRVGNVGGFAMLAAGVAAGLAATLWAMGEVGLPRVVLNQDTAIDGHELLWRFGPKAQHAPSRVDLHAGAARVGRFGWWSRGPVLSVRDSGQGMTMLLADPRTGVLRPVEEIRQLSEVLAASPHETDRVAGRAVGELAMTAALAGPRPDYAPGWEPEEIAHSTWSALKSVGRGLAHLVVIATIFFFGGLTESDRESLRAGAAANWSVYVLMLTGVALLALWVFASAYRLSILVGALARAARARGAR
jgi:hypothetical protein